MGRAPTLAPTTTWRLPIWSWPECSPTWPPESCGTTRPAAGPPTTRTWPSSTTRTAGTKWRSYQLQAVAAWAEWRGIKGWRRGSGGANITVKTYRKKQPFCQIDWSYFLTEQKLSSLPWWGKNFAVFGVCLKTGNCREIKIKLFFPQRKALNFVLFYNLVFKENIWKNSSGSDLNKPCIYLKTFILDIKISVCRYIVLVWLTLMNDGLYNWDIWRFSHFQSVFMTDDLFIYLIFLFFLWLINLFLQCTHMYVTHDENTFCKVLRTEQEFY